MAKKDKGGQPRCKACGFPMIMDETIIDGRANQRIVRRFLHCVNGQCGHIDRVSEAYLEPSAT